MTSEVWTAGFLAAGAIWIADKTLGELVSAYFQRAWFAWIDAIKKQRDLAPSNVEQVAMADEFPKLPSQDPVTPPSDRRNQER